MSKKLDLTKSVYELVNQYPEVSTILVELGFKDITNKVMLNSMGKVMTLEKGAKVKGIDIEDIKAKFIEAGFTVEDESTNTNNRTDSIKSYLKRLGEGEDLEKVREDFVAEFKDVDASEIMMAEQDLIKEGTPLNEVQRLCDVHSALFHGATREEKIANAEKAVEESLSNKNNKDSQVDEETEDMKRARLRASQPGMADKKVELAAELVAIEGHPLYTFTLENNAFENLVIETEEAIEKGHVSYDLLNNIRGIAIHYAKKGDLLYPHLKAKYGISGPSDVMWTVDDEIRDELASLAKAISNQDAEWMNRLGAVLTRAKEMVYKEANILFPNCAVNFTEEEWINIYFDSKDYASCFGVENGIWQLAEENKSLGQTLIEGTEIRMPGGHMTLEELTAMLNTMPFEISFVDAEDFNRYFNEGPKDFKRPGMAIDRKVFSCHPPIIEQKVRRIIDEFRNGTLDEVPVWMEKNGKTMLVKYMAVRDKTGKYLGTMELVQDMTFAKEHFLK